MISTPEVCILKTDGTNCDVEMSYAFESNGAKTETVHVNQLREGDRKLNDYEALALSGGFSYGDDIASGKVLANELASFLSDELQEFVDDMKPVLGVCNGFQVLVKTGLLPYRDLSEQSVTLTNNINGKFECRWVDLRVMGNTLCKFAKADDFYEAIPMQIAHGEGRLFGRALDINGLLEDGQVVFQYSNKEGQAAQGEFPNNPNGSMQDIAGICDRSGLILGMMPHPERSISSFHPDRRRTESARAAAELIFGNIVNYARQI